MATEYHDTDFCWSTLKGDGELFEQYASQLPSRLEESEIFAKNASGYWDKFHKDHMGQFYRPRRYILQAFPELQALVDSQDDKLTNVLEVGCGNGSNVYPLLEKSNKIRLYVSDIAPTAVQSLGSHDMYGKCVGDGRIVPFLWCAVTGRTPTPFSPILEKKKRKKKRKSSVVHLHSAFSEHDKGALSDSSNVNSVIQKASLHSTLSLDALNTLPIAIAEGGQMDIVLLTFLLSAIRPGEEQLAALRNIRSQLKEGGILCFRDYARYDMNQLRAKPENILSANLHVKNGTFIYFFVLEDLPELFAAAGFRLLESRYACINQVNRAKGLEMKRTWIHAKAVAI